MSEGLIPGGGGGNGIMLYTGTLGEIARLLDGAGQELDGQAPKAPQAPDAGICTAVIAATLAHFGESLGGVVDAFGTTANAVIHNEQVYIKAEQASTVRNTPTKCEIIGGP